MLVIDMQMIIIVMHCRSSFAVKMYKHVTCNKANKVECMCMRYFLSGLTTVNSTPVSTPTVRHDQATSRDQGNTFVIIVK